MRLFLLALLAAAVAGCKDKPAAAAAPSASAAVSSAPSAGPAASSTPPPKAEKLEVEAIKTALKCRKGDGPCEVLSQFKDCIEWSPVAKSGDGRWLGKGYVVKNGAFIEEWTILRTKSVPSSEAPGALPAKIAIENIPDDRPGEILNADKAVRAFERGDVALPTNTAIKYLKERKEWGDAPAVAAENNQVYVATGSGAHLCAIPGPKLVMVRRSIDRSHPGDGTYALLYPVTW